MLASAMPGHGLMVTAVRQPVVIIFPGPTTPPPLRRARRAGGDV